MPRRGWLETVQPVSSGYRRLSRDCTETIPIPATTGKIPENRRGNLS
jgi:hypothetical protein